jgi:hypothetical protein
LINKKAGAGVPYNKTPEVIDTKINSILTHKSQVVIKGEWWLYGIKGRAMYRGYQINVKYAEAFEVVKEIKRI